MTCRHADSVAHLVVVAEVAGLEEGDGYAGLLGHHVDRAEGADAAEQALHQFDALQGEDSAVDGWKKQGKNWGGRCDKV